MRRCEASPQLRRMSGHSVCYPIIREGSSLPLAALIDARREFARRCVHKGCSVKLFAALVKFAVARPKSGELAPHEQVFQPLV
jgi:hypothetical protein